MYGMSSGISGAEDMIVGEKIVGNERILTICDEDVYGKRLNFNGVVFYVNPRFYSGKKMKEEDIKPLLKNATIINAIGKNSVNVCLKNKYARKEDLIYIDGVPHIQIFSLPKIYK